MPESEKNGKEYLREIIEINKKLEKNKTQLGRIKDLGEGKGTIHAGLEKERKQLNLDYEKNARLYAKYAHEKNMGAVNIMYWDTMIPNLQLSKRISNAANDYSLSPPSTEGEIDRLEVERREREEQKHQEEKKSAAEYIEKIKNAQNEHGFITHAERERDEDERALNKLRGLGSIPNDEALIYSPTGQQIQLHIGKTRVSGRSPGVQIFQKSPQLRPIPLDKNTSDAFKSDLANFRQPRQISAPASATKPTAPVSASVTKSAVPVAGDAVEDALNLRRSRWRPPRPLSLKAQPDDGPIYDGMGGRRKTRRGRQVRRSKAKRTRREKRVRKSRKVIKRKAHKSRKVIKRKAHKLRRH